MPDILATTAALRNQLMETLVHGKTKTFIEENYKGEKLSKIPQLTDADVIITHVEVNEWHGVGILVSRLFGNQPNIFSLRSKNLYLGEHAFGARDACLSYEGQTRAEMFEQVIQAFKGVTVARVLCIPYFVDDVRSALLIHEIFEVPLCTFIMDDQNIRTNGIPDSLMAKLLSKSKLCLAISHELQQAYQSKYDCPFYFLPPGVPNHLITPTPSQPITDMGRGIMIGNIWSQEWLDLLCNTLRGTGIEIPWYGNHQKCSWLNLDSTALARDGILLRAPLEEEALVEKLRSSSFALIPSGTLNEYNEHQAIAELSLPSRIPFILATANTPLLVLGNARTAAAQFVRRFGVGLSCNYETRSFQRALNCILSVDTQFALRKRATTLSECFGSDDMAEWIWQSLAEGKVCSSKLGKFALLQKNYEDIVDLSKEGISCSHF